LTPGNDGQGQATAMADEIRSYPPTERRLARLRSLGIVPLSRALVGAGVIVAAWLLVLLAGPAVAEWFARVLAGCFEIASTATGVDDVRPALGWIAAHTAMIVAVVGLICLGVAALATQMQLGGWGRGAGAPSGGALPAQAGAAARLTPSGREAGWMVMTAAIAVVSVILAARGTLSYGEQLMSSGPRELAAATARMALGIGWRVVATLVGLGLLDCLMQRAAVLQAAWMSRREMEEEARLTQGHPLTLERRSRRLRRLHHA